MLVIFFSASFNLTTKNPSDCADYAEWPSLIPTNHPGGLMMNKQLHNNNENILI